MCLLSTEKHGVVFSACCRVGICQETWKFNQQNKFVNKTSWILTGLFVRFVHVEERYIIRAGSLLQIAMEFEHLQISMGKVFVTGRFSIAAFEYKRVVSGNPWHFRELKKHVVEHAKGLVSATGNVIQLAASIPMSILRDFRI